MNKKRTIRNNKKNKIRRSKRRGGSCGCNTMPLPKVYGGSAYLSAVPPQAYYPYNNDLTNDPTSPANVHSARFMGDYSRMSGGGRRKKRQGRRSKKMKGGMNFLTSLYNQIQDTGSSMHYINATGLVNAMNNQTNLIGGIIPQSTSSSYSQPVTTDKYGFSNPPLA